MTKPKRQVRKSQTGSSNKSRGKLKRNLVYGIVAVIAVIAAVFLTRDNKSSAVTQDPRENATTELAPLRTEFLKEGLLSFYTRSAEYIASIDIELAETNDERRLGMMFRKTMGDNQGMFFIFPYDDMQAFWMKNTILPLDMLFINSDNEIVTIHENTTPYAETSYPSTRPAKFVLEVNAGFAERIGIHEGDKIGWMRTN